MPDISLDLRYLHCAMTVAEQGSFRRAALAVELPQSTISRRVQLLERRLGFPLFVRDRRGARLTAAGDAFLKDAVVGVSQLTRAAKTAVAAQRGEKGELRIGILGSLTSGYLNCVLRRFRENHPDINLILRETSAEENHRGLATGALDISFVTGNPKALGLSSMMLWTESIFAVLPTAHPLASHDAISWSDLRQETFIVSSGGPGSEIHDYVIRMLSQPGFRPRIDIHDVSRESLFTLVAMEYGLTLTSTSSIRKNIDGVVFRPILGEEDSLRSSAVWSSENLNPALQRLLDIAVQVSREWPTPSSADCRQKI